MKFIDEHTAQLPFLGGAIQAQRLVVPAEVIRGIKSYRHACRLAWKLRSPRNLTYSGLAERSGGKLYVSHVSDYFSRHDNRRKLPAEAIALTESIIGNTVISQYQAHCAHLTVLEELQAERQRRVA